MIVICHVGWSGGAFTGQNEGRFFGNASQSLLG
jgi:hypothetical protein